MLKRRILALVVLVAGLALGLAVVRSSQPTPPSFLAKYPFHLGLDLSGGSHLLYKADISTIPAGTIDDSMDALRDVIERRVNAFGVGEPVVTVQTSTLTAEKEYRLSVELPGITDVADAIDMIGQTPYLEFRTQSNELPEDALTKAVVDENGMATVVVDQDAMFVPSDLTGKYLKRASIFFNPTSSKPEISLEFNDEGAVLFEQITRDNVGKVVAIYLDGSVISAPVVQGAITGGQAQITGDFTPNEAKELVGRLNSGALPVPISLISTQTVGATLGTDAIVSGMQAAFIGFIIVALFLILWYRLPGLVAVLALGIYVVMTLVLYKLIPVTLTAAGIAGFIISIGIAVDANILIFERFREERARGKKNADALDDGFARAWHSIRDANIAAVIIAVILFWFGSSLIKGFALTLGLGVIVSLISAITITKLFLLALPKMEDSRIGRFLFSSGFRS